MSESNFPNVFLQQVVMSKFCFLSFLTTVIIGHDLWGLRIFKAYVHCISLLIEALKKL